MNEMMKIFFSLSVSGSIIALILFALKPLLKNKFSKTWQYYIWLIVIVRLLLPFSLETNIVGQLFSKVDVIITAQNTNEIMTGQNEITESINDIPASIEDFIPQPSQINGVEEAMQQEKTSNYWNEIKNNIWLLWLGIAIMLLVRKITSYHSFVRYIKAGISEVADNKVLEIYKTACKTAGLKKPLNIYSNKLATSPMLVGIFRNFIVLPDIEVGENELHNIFIHELTHYKRLDIFYKWLTQFAVCLHWYNPLVYLISREINKNCELSCDEVIIRKLDHKAKRSYGDTLLATLKTNGNYGDSIVSITLNEDAKLLKERLGAIMKFRKKSKIAIAFSTILSVVIFCGATITGAYGATSKVNNVTSNSNINVNDIIDFNRLPNMTKDEVDALAITYINATGEFGYVYNLRQFMSTKGIDAAVNTYLNKTGNQNPGLVSSMLQFMSKDAAESVVKKYNWIYPADFLEKNYDGKSNNNVANKTADSFTNADTPPGAWWRWLGLEEVLPFMSKEGIDKAVEIYNQRHLGFEITASDYYDMPPYTPYTAEEADKRGKEIMELSGTWGQTMDQVLPYMSKEGINKAVEIYNQKHPNDKKAPSDYYNMPMPISMLTTEQADFRGIEIIELSGTWPSALRRTYKTFTTDQADERSLLIVQYGIWGQAMEEILPYMSKEGIDKAIEIYNQKHPEQRKIASDYHGSQQGTETSPTINMNPLNDVDKIAIEFITSSMEQMPSLYLDIWQVVELYFPNMSENGIDVIVELYNQYTFTDKKEASDYYNKTGESADSRALTIMRNNGMWKYVEPLFPYMTNAGIDKVVAEYNQKHQGNEKVASDYYN